MGSGDDASTGENTEESINPNQRELQGDPEIFEIEDFGGEEGDVDEEIHDVSMQAQGVFNLDSFGATPSDGLHREALGQHDESAEDADNAARVISEGDIDPSIFKEDTAPDVFDEDTAELPLDDELDSGEGGQDSGSDPGRYDEISVSYGDPELGGYKSLPTIEAEPLPAPAQPPPPAPAPPPPRPAPPPLAEEGLPTEAGPPAPVADDSGSLPGPEVTEEGPPIDQAVAAPERPTEEPITDDETDQVAAPVQAEVRVEGELEVIPPQNVVPAGPGAGNYALDAAALNVQIVPRNVVVHVYVPGENGKRGEVMTFEEAELGIDTIEQVRGVAIPIDAVRRQMHDLHKTAKAAENVHRFANAYENPSFAIGSVRIPWSWDAVASLACAGWVLPAMSLTKNAVQARIPFGSWVKMAVNQAIDAAVAGIAKMSIFTGPGVVPGMIAHVGLDALIDPASMSMGEFDKKLMYEYEKAKTLGLSEDEVLEQIGPYLHGILISDEKGQYTREMKKKALLLVAKALLKLKAPLVPWERIGQMPELRGMQERIMSKLDKLYPPVNPWIREKASDHASKLEAAHRPAIDQSHQSEHKRLLKLIEIEQGDVENLCEFIGREIVEQRRLEWITEEDEQNFATQIQNEHARSNMKVLHGIILILGRNRDNKEGEAFQNEVKEQMTIGALNKKAEGEICALKAREGFVRAMEGLDQNRELFAEYTMRLQTGRARGALDQAAVDAAENLLRTKGLQVAVYFLRQKEKDYQAWLARRGGRGRRPRGHR
jgi:hypothetical protein